MVSLDDVLTSINNFPDQCLQAWQESSQIVFPDDYKHVHHIVACGMGGSRFTPKTIKELYRDQIKLPYEVVDDYTLPNYVNANSLVILSSYSGTTEEIVACGQDAIKRGAKLTGITSGGPVADLLKNHPAYIFDPIHNPSGQPRIGSGYLLLGHLGLLKSVNLIDLDPTEVTSAIAFIRQLDTHAAKTWANLFKDKYPFIITAEFLKGFGNAFANQINETAKMISDYRHIPELNHHLLEGLQYPATFREQAVFIFILSNLYSSPIHKRFAITQDVVAKQQLATYTIKLTGPGKLAQVLEAYTLSGLITFHLSALYGVDPAVIPWVNYFKNKLK